ncbi:MAG: hypothetical protein H6555_03250 [Lewinellaceae bacterium]|nr:hypothetical protein [Lewinellaceae bacterium]
MTNAEKLFWIKVLHTIIWAFFAGLVFYILYAGLVDQVTTFTYVAIGFVLLEAATLLVFSWKCPLTIVAERYSAPVADNFDIFLPEWLARHNKSIFTTLFVIGLLLVGWRTWF